MDVIDGIVGNPSDSELLNRVKILSMVFEFPSCDALWTIIMEAGRGGKAGGIFDFGNVTEPRVVSR